MTIASLILGVSAIVMSLTSLYLRWKWRNDP